MNTLSLYDALASKGYKLATKEGWPMLKVPTFNYIVAYYSTYFSIFMVFDVSIFTNKKNLTLVIQKPKDYDILAIPLTAAALRVLTARKGTPDEWRQYLSSS